MTQSRNITNNNVGKINILKALRKRELHYKFKRGQILIPLDPSSANNPEYTQQRNRFIGRPLIKQESDC